jgi:hypothetical protein
MRELTDIELDEVAGGIGSIAVGSVNATGGNTVVVGVQANATSLAGGGVGKTNVAAGTDGVWIGNVRLS